jgi:hypothetical protein
MQTCEWICVDLAVWKLISTELICAELIYVRTDTRLSLREAQEARTLLIFRPTCNVTG